MSALTDLVAGFAQLLTEEADPTQNITWSTSGVYADDVTGIFVMVVPPSPDRLVALTPYPMGDDPALGDSMTGLQVRSRSVAQDPRDVFALDDATFDVLAGNYPLTLPNGIKVNTVRRTSAVSLGQDTSHRWEWSSNYEVTYYRPSPHRL